METKDPSEKIEITKRRRNICFPVEKPKKDYSATDAGTTADLHDDVQIKAIRRSRRNENLTKKGEDGTLFSHLERELFNTRRKLLSTLAVEGDSTEAGTHATDNTQGPDGSFFSLLLLSGIIVIDRITSIC